MSNESKAVLLYIKETIIITIIILIIHTLHTIEIVISNININVWYYFIWTNTYIIRRKIGRIFSNYGNSTPTSYFFVKGCYVEFIKKIDIVLLFILFMVPVLFSIPVSVSKIFLNCMYIVSFLGILMLNSCFLYFVKKYL